MGIFYNETREKAKAKSKEQKADGILKSKKMIRNFYSQITVSFCRVGHFKIKRNGSRTS
jgi:hypothetical protein